MLNRELLRELCARYRGDLPFRLKQIAGLLEARRCFSENFSIEAEDFPAMLCRALKRDGGLLLIAGRYSKTMILRFAEEEPETVRAMFRLLYSESRELWRRVDSFKRRADILLSKLDEHARDSFQDEYAISVYLWLHNPKKYTIYQFQQTKALIERVDGGYSLKKGAYEENLRQSFAFTTELRAALFEEHALLHDYRALFPESAQLDRALSSLAFDLARFAFDERHGRTSAREDAVLPDELLKGEFQAPRAGRVVATTSRGSIAAKKRAMAKRPPPLFLPDSMREGIRTALRERRAALLRGPLGCGKTLMARTIAGEMASKRDIDRLPSRPGMPPEEFAGAFRAFAERAARGSGRRFVLLIDDLETLRVPDIFRGVGVRDLPRNLLLLFTENTGAGGTPTPEEFRRAVPTIDIPSALNSPAFALYRAQLESLTLDRLVAAVVAINAELPEENRIGHGVFCGLTRDLLTPERLTEITSEVLRLLSMVDTDSATHARWEKMVREAAN